MQIFRIEFTFFCNFTNFSFVIKVIFAEKHLLLFLSIIRNESYADNTSDVNMYPVLQMKTLVCWAHGLNSCQIQLSVRMCQTDRHEHRARDGECSKCFFFGK